MILEPHADSATATGDEIRSAFDGQLHCSSNHSPSGLLGVNTTGIASRPLTKLAGRSGKAASVASLRSGNRSSTRRVMRVISSRAN